VNLHARPLIVLPAIVLLLATIAGCATQRPQPAPPSAAELDRLQRSGDGAPAAREPAQPRSPLENPASPLYRKVVYFDYDTTEIRPEGAALLRTHANYIYQTLGARVTLQGHTDERGTRDYNLALGEQRADAVQRFLIAEGVPAERLSRLSYGEERPAERGSSERAWALNRRVELVY
jgi:peptidoglycan-associated lipoprotein